MNKIDILINTINELNIIPAASFDGSKLLGDLSIIEKQKHYLKYKGLNKIDPEKRWTRNYETSLRIFGQEPSSNFEKLLEFTYDSCDKILGKMIDGMSGRYGKHDKRLVASSIVKYLHELDRKNELIIDYSECFDGENIKQNMHKFSCTCELYTAYENEYKNYNSFDEKEVIDSVKKMDFTNKTIAQINNVNEIKRLRSIFRKKLEFESNNLYGNTFAWNNKFGYPDAAHIISVKWCIENDQIEKITDPNNGLLLDPNTHRLLDRGEIMSWDELNVNKIFENDERKANVEFAIREKIYVNK